ncbi:PhzF family phenazine biosynthesis protein [Peribacillus butanolivorans]|uniref:PhzF family phenazine biosynthesis protein n=1 Tax=Peribacillus butanolivorans TaxID=421767 RepID=UPI00366E81B2
MKKYEYTLVDVFTTESFGGNQLAVFEDAEGLTTKMMQVLANELNLSETAFVFSASEPHKTKKVRIFTPKLELPMAGHPTIGTATVLAAKGIVATEEGRNEWVFEEGVGDIPLTVHKEKDVIKKTEMEQPLAEFGEKFLDAEVVAQLLSLHTDDIDTTLPIQAVSTGVPFLFIPICSLEAMEKIRFRTDIWKEHFSANLERQHIFTFTTETVEKTSHVHSRMFAPAMGIAEDPATGGASGPLGAYLIEYGVIPSTEEGVYHIRGEQGFEMGRRSYIDITIQKTQNTIQQIKVGGPAIIIGSGQIYLHDEV